MRVIEPYHEEITETNPYKKIEIAGRTCYKSEALITEDSYKEFLKIIKNKHHESVFEHVTLYFSVSEAIYTLFLSLAGYAKYFKISKLKNDSGIYQFIISGSVRSFRDLFTRTQGKFIGTDIELAIQYFYKYLMDTYILFFDDVIVNIAASLTRSSNMFTHVDIKEITVSCLSYEEALIHRTWTVRVVCDRGVTHEIVRHRPVAYSQESTRYCNYSKDKFNSNVTFIRPPWVNLSTGVYDESSLNGMCASVANSDLIWLISMISVEKDYLNLLNYGWSPQQARDVLPNSLKTEIIITADFSEWQHIFSLRTAETAHPQMREIMLPVQESFYEMLKRNYKDK
jgi:thymidylate synthase (FAD)